VKFENKSARGLQGDVIEEPDVNIGRLLEVHALGVTRSGAIATIAEGQTNY
jgi:hypothetical protein